MTPNANAALASLIQSPDVPDGAGVRFAREAGPDGEAAIGLTLVTEADPTDEVIDTPAGVEIYVAPDAAETLSGQVLDAEMDGERMAFSIRPPS